MTPLRFFLLLLTVTLASSNVAIGDERPIRYAFQVFQLGSGFTKKTSLREKIWRASDKTWNRMKDEVTLFDSAEFRNGKDKLVFRSKSCFWNEQMLTFEEGKNAKLPDKLKLISSPYVKRKEKELVKLKIRSEQPYEYMEPREDDLFKLKEIKLPTGLDIEIRAHTAGRDVYDVDHLKLHLRVVTEREPAEGTRLPVGKPVLKESEYKLSLRIEEYDSYGILLQPKGMDSMIVIRFEVDDK